jgi:hypothetical protein
MNPFKHFTKIALIAMVIGLLSACNKEDTTPPVITVLGDNPFNLEMLNTYADPGASADDDEDGDISSSIIVDASDINKNLPGAYDVLYSVTDAAGNQALASREVIVFATTAALARSYSVIDTTTSGGSPIVYTYQQTISAVNSSTIGFNKFADYSNNNGITATINSNGTITIPTQTAQNIGQFAEDHEFSGSGFVTSTGIYISYIDKNLSAGNAIANCKAYFTR